MAAGRCFVKSRTASGDQGLPPGRLTVLQAERVMGWTAKRNRFNTEGGGWTPAWRFQPLRRIEDAFKLLEAADPEEYSIDARRGGIVTARVHLAAGTGEAHAFSRARAITHAVARAIGLDVPDPAIEVRDR